MDTLTLQSLIFRAILHLRIRHREQRYHPQLIDTILNWLQENAFSINPLKCEWPVQVIGWLGYWLTPTGLKPWKKKIDTVLRMEEPNNLKQLRGFVGAIHYYRGMWPHRSHIIAPLTSKTRSQKRGEIKVFKMIDKMEKAFKGTKALIATDILAAFHDHSKHFHSYTYRWWVVIPCHALTITARVLASFQLT